MINIQNNVQLKNYNSFHLAATAKYFVELNKQTDLIYLTQYLTQNPQPCMVIGAGTNIVLSKNINNLLIKINLKGKKIVTEDENSWLVEAAAAEDWHKFIIWTLQQGIFGLENLALIPSSVGAAPIQNIGAYGAEVKDFIDSIVVLDLTNGKQLIFNNEQCKFSYRDSIFKQNIKILEPGVVAVKYLILAVRFRLTKSWQANLSYKELQIKLSQQSISQPSAVDIFNLICEIRRNKLPDVKQMGNVGSFFKNPIITKKQFADIQKINKDIVSYPMPENKVKLSAGWLIDNCGLKGHQMGNVAVYNKQALVLVNLANASGAEVIQLSNYVQQQVAQKFGVILETEPLII